MNKIDLEIYRQKIEDGVDFDAMAIEFQCDKNALVDAFMTELTIKAESNMIDNGDPTVDMMQFTECISAAVTRVHLDDLVKMGLVQVDFDVERGENVYSLTDFM
jgi:hypothetical protein